MRDRSTGRRLAPQLHDDVIAITKCAFYCMSSAGIVVLRRTSDIFRHLTGRPGGNATGASFLVNQLNAKRRRVSLCGRIQRLRVVFHVAGNQRRFAGVADPGSTGPPHGHIACFCKFEQALVFCIPRQT
jgi:hypothetical protein